MNSMTTSAPRALDASGACRFNSTSASGMKSTQRTMCILVPWAKAGARPEARMPSSPVAAMPTAAAPLRNARRSTVCDPVCARLRVEVVMDPSMLSGRLGLVDLLELAFGPLHGVFGLHALDALGVHVRDNVLRESLGRVRRRRPGVPEQPRIARRSAEHLERLVELAPHGVVLPDLGGADAVALLRLEPLAVVLFLVHPAEEVLGELLVL